MTLELPLQFGPGDRTSKIPSFAQGAKTMQKLTPESQLETKKKQKSNSNALAQGPIIRVLRV
ncbi:hypothetical protein L873DRAFT_1814426 [Choiromyces venosus 120613-1]|uniref:Uncharacterized protein n=1 Tax=Choiromyces venosus 120613-1 TaxID=1336337 RepID=A0A3N4JBP5_9PEZI|nr:hypothetical protein L873DRAFT_1814426 [Choiromyces venosus 120613-1]